MQGRVQAATHSPMQAPGSCSPAGSPRLPPADTNRHMSVFLTTPGSCSPNHVLHELAILDQSGRGRHIVRASKPRDGPLYAPYRWVGGLEPGSQGWVS